MATHTQLCYILLSQMNILPYFLKAMFQKTLSISYFPPRLSKVLFPSLTPLLMKKMIQNIRPCFLLLSIQTHCSLSEVDILNLETLFSWLLVSEQKLGGFLECISIRDMLIWQIEEFLYPTSILGMIYHIRADAFIFFGL